MTKKRNTSNWLFRECVHYNVCSVPDKIYQSEHPFCAADLRAKLDLEQGDWLDFYIAKR